MKKTQPTHSPAFYFCDGLFYHFDDKKFHIDRSNLLLTFGQLTKENQTIFKVLYTLCVNLGSVPEEMVYKYLKYKFPSMGIFQSEVLDYFVVNEDNKIKMYSYEDMSDEQLKSCNNRIDEFIKFKDEIIEKWQKATPTFNTVNPSHNNKIKNQYNEKGEKHGIWETHHFGCLTIERYKDGKLNGLYECYDSNGKLFNKGFYKDDKKCGLWEYYNLPDGGLHYKEHYKNGKTYMYFYHLNGKLHEQKCYKNGKLHGLKKSYYQSGEISSIEYYKDGKPHGKHISYGLKGKISRLERYKDGKYHGVCERYYNGHLEYKKYYKNGKKHGIHESYFTSGRLDKIIRYKEGKYHGISEYYHYGTDKLSCKDWYKNGLEIKSEHYYENGQLEYRRNYIKGKEPIIRKVYNGDTYEEGVPHGIWETYDKNGKLTSKIIYKNGEIIKEINN
jgi:antitoxin component YwqK of YwqJK toxin-antitoxin module